MSRSQPRRICTTLPILLAALAGCQDISAPLKHTLPQFAQGAGGVWTVNTLDDPGDGVCDDAHCTLREAIATATSGGSIVFASGLHGTIELTEELVIQYKVLSINGGGAIALDAQRASRVLRVYGVLGPVTNVELSGLTLTNGLAPSAVDHGGGILVDGADLTLDGITLSNNAALVGGGIFVASSVSPATQVTIRNSLIYGNMAQADGAGIHISNSATLALSNSTVDGNEAGRGGGIFNYGTLVVTASTISNNEGRISDGGISNRDGANAAVVLSTISGNRGTGIAGAVGGILNLGALQLRSSTVTRNSATSRGGLAALNGIAIVENTIIAGNTVLGGFPDCDLSPGSLTSGGYNRAGPSCPFAAAGDVTVNPLQVFSHVLDQTLADNGGPTKTHALLARGLAADAGYCPGETADQRGFSRPVDDPTTPNARDACDVGAYELQGPVVAVADLIVSQAVDKASVKQGELLTYTVRVRNLGPQTAPNVVLTNTLSSGVTFVEARVTRGTHTAPLGGETGVVTWNIGDMLDQANEFAEIQVTVLIKGKTTITNMATATTDAVDPNTANNTAAITVTVAPGGSAGRKK